MAARKQLFHPDEVREKIRTSQLINRLSDNAFGDIEPELSAGQIKSIDILLRKAIPDLQAVQVTGKDGGPIETKDISDFDLAKEVARLIAKASV